MKKNKALNVLIRILKTIARVLILNIPAVIILLALLAADQLSWISAGISLLAFWAISGIIVFYVFKDLDDFMAYLKKLAQGFEPELPKLHWGVFSSMRLTKTFLSVKNLWSNQFASADSVLQNLPNPMLMVDKDQKIVFVNVSAKNLLGNKLLGKKLRAVFEDPALFSITKEVIGSNKLSKTITELDLKDSTDQIRTFQVKVDHLPAPTKDGAIVVLSFFDITPFKLFKVQQADFFANASHELKTPLAIISGSVETLQGSAKNDSAARNKFLSLIAEQTTRMTGLVQNMLQLSRLQIDVPLSPKKSFSLNDLIQKVVDDFNVRAKALHKKIILNKQPHLPLFLANRNDLYHIFQNLVDNALKYGAAKSDVHISTYLDTTPSPTLVVAIHNTGDPIPPEHLSRIWDKFYRVNSAQTLSVEGSGLGLGIVQSIVRKYQGRIEVVSDEETGTTFTVYFPVLS
ncbi:MAG: GHKL domain-containing protein [Alphaproteobacteria bacterium]|nr:GHKL domain-containing protein [Alphaproteobacteria bacterium]